MPVDVLILYAHTDCQVKWAFLAAIFVFELGSLICGVAPNSSTLIGGRAIAGCGVAGIFSGALVILSFSSMLTCVRTPAHPIY